MDMVSNKFPSIKVSYCHLAGDSAFCIRSHFVFILQTVLPVFEMDGLSLTQEPIQQLDLQDAHLHCCRAQFISNTKCSIDSNFFHRY